MTFQPLPRRSTAHQRVKRPAFTALAALAMASLGACAGAGGPTPTQAQATSAAATVTQPVTHNCQPKETVAFSCELHDGRLLSMCASPDLAAFKGEPKDNPGYAYLVLGTPQGAVHSSYPPNPYAYKEHFFKDVSVAVIPFMFVTSDKGRFFFISERDVDDPLGAGQWTPENLPNGWTISKKEQPRACARVLEFDNYFAAGVPHASAWRDKERERSEAEKAKVQQP